MAADIHVHTGEELNQQFFDAPVRVSRIDDPNDNLATYVMVTFANGGQLSIHTREPLVWIEPERH
jgi:hypothetical protein